MAAQNTLEVMARLGHGARGVVYCLVGGLALFAAIGSGGSTGGSGSALRTLVEQPFGRVLLGLIAIGFACFALWRFVEATTDADRRGNEWKGLAIRGAHLVGGAIAVGLAVSALGLALGWGGGGGEDRSARDWTAWLMGQPFGPWLVGLVGLGVVGAGIAFIAKGWRGKVTKHLVCSRDVARWAVPAGRLGFGARGVVFLIMGGFLVVAAVQSRAAQARGLGGALQALEAQPFGWVLLVVTAAGLFAFGVFSFIEAVYRRIDAPDLDGAKDAVVDGVRNLGS
jgi:Domain of Unknown Function (DUF1206)